MLVPNTKELFDLIVISLCEGGATECTLPHFINGTANKEEVFDLVHVRDVIQHLTLNQGLKYYCNVFLSGARILVTTSYKAKVNIDIQEGGYYDNNVYSLNHSHFQKGIVFVMIE